MLLCDINLENIKSEFINEFPDDIEGIELYSDEKY
jgi:hypothetical protein